jgi:octaprenyl-diphosphate synthase
MNKKLSIAEPIAVELDKFIAYYKESIFCNNVRIQGIIDHIMKSDGKHIRPILLLFAAKACGEVNETTYHTAVTIELLHTASLIHDDVVDESKLRRGKPSVNAIYDNKMAVLTGDYFLSTALIKSVLTGNIEIISEVSTLGRNLAEGELNQLSLVKELILDEQEYFEVIKKKTASLMSVCMKVGAISVSASPEQISKFEQLGECIGMCFQLRDDIFDYFTNNVGKPTGNDIREGKVTLPLLYALDKTSGSERDKMYSIISSYDYTDENIQMLISYAKENGGIDYASSKMDEYKNKALDIINDIDNQEIREGLRNVINYVVDRNY